MHFGLVLSVPIILYSDLPATLVGWQPPKFLGFQYVGFVLGSIVFFLLRVDIFDFCVARTKGPFAVKVI